MSYIKIFMCLIKISICLIFFCLCNTLKSKQLNQVGKKRSKRLKINAISQTGAKTNILAK